MLTLRLIEAKVGAKTNGGEKGTPTAAKNLIGAYLNLMGACLNFMGAYPSFMGAYTSFMGAYLSLMGAYPMVTQTRLTA